MFFTKFNKLNQHKVECSLLPSLVLVFLFSVGITMLMFLLQPNDFRELLHVFKQTHGLTFFLNFLPVFLFGLLFYFLLNSVVWSSSIIGLLVIVLSFVNRYKIQLRQDPLLPWDFQLADEAATVLRGVDMRLFLGFAITLVIILLVIVVLAQWIRTKKLNHWLRVIASVILFLLLFSLNKTVFSNTKVFDGLCVVGNIYNQEASFNSKGFLYSFIYATNKSQLKKFDGYQKASVMNLEHEMPVSNFPTPDTEQKRPHVFMIMGEAFSEIGDNPNISYDNYVDPLQYFKEIRKESIYGHIVVPDLGGGTADTEFDVLTGISTRNFRGVPYSYQIVLRSISALPHLLTNMGYNNIALHPGYKWFYNRQNVYPFFGFSEFIDITAFPEDVYKGMYVSETATMDRYIQNFENYIKTHDDPFFNFLVTIQNHGPYNNKYMSETNFETTLPLEADDINALSNYFEGLSDADRELKRLYDYMNASNEPIVLVYFGDHLPGFRKQVYELLTDSDENDITANTNRYSTPFIIYQNEAAKKLVDFEQTKEKYPLPDYGRISSNFLGVYLQSLLNFEPFDAYTQYCLSVFEQYPIILENQYFDQAGTLHDSVAENTLLNNFRYWQYYKLFDE